MSRKWVKNFLFSQKKSIFYLLILIIFLKIIYFIIYSPNPDYNVFFWDGEYFLQGDLPYRDFTKLIYLENDAGIHIHPPLYYYFNFLLNVCSGNNIIIFNYLARVVFNIFDLLTIFTLYKLCTSFFSHKISLYLSILYSFSPLSMIFFGFYGSHESIAQLITVASILFFVKKKYGISALLIGLGFSYIIMPVFILLAICPYFLKQHQIKQMILFILEVLLCYLITSLPFLILIPSEFIQYQIYMLGRVQAAIFLNDTILEFFTTHPILIPFLNLSISYINLFQLLVVVILFLLLFIIPKNKTSIIDSMFLVLISLVILTFTVHQRLFYWFMPMALLYYYKNSKLDFKDGKMISFFIFQLIFILIFNIVLSILQVSLWSTVDVSDQLQLFNWYGFCNTAFVIYQIEWIIAMFIFNFQKILCRKFAPIYFIYLICFNLIFYVEINMIPEFIKDIVAIVSIILTFYIVIIWIKNTFNDGYIPLKIIK